MKGLAALIILIWATARPAFSNDLWFPQVAAGGGYTTRIRIAHVDTRNPAAATGRLFFYNQDGSPRIVTTAEAGTGSDFPLTISYEGTATLTITSSGTVAVGSAVFRGTPTFVGGVSTYTFGSTSVGVYPAREVSVSYLPMTLRAGYDTGIAVANSSASTISVQFRLLNPSGAPGQSGSTIQIPMNGQIARLVGPELGFSGLIPDGSTLEVRVIGAGRFAAVSLFLGNGYISSAPPITPDDLETPLYIPQVAVGGGYSMIFRTFNSSNMALGGSLRFRDTAGKPMTVTIQGAGGGGIVGPVTSDSLDVASVPPNGTMVWDVSVSGGLKTGYAIWEAYIPNNPDIRIPVESGVSATIFHGAVHVGEAGTTPYYSAAILVDVGPGINTGVALATSGLNGSQLSVSLRNASGALVTQPSLPFLSPLPAGNQISRYASELFGNTPISGGYMKVESTGPDGFLPLAILDNAGVFSTTAVIRRYKIDPALLLGTYLGGWMSLSSQNSGTMNFTVTQEASPAKTLRMDISIMGNVFGEFLVPQVLTCTYTQEGCFTTFGSTYGPGIIAVKPDGTLSGRLRPPGANTFFALDGYITAQSLWAADRFGWDDAIGNGVLSLSK